MEVLKVLEVGHIEAFWEEPIDVDILRKHDGP
mgnify:CR=1 FL=1